MIILISPSKNMIGGIQSLQYNTLPQFPDETSNIIEVLKQLSNDQRAKILKCSGKVLSLANERLDRISLHEGLCAAISSFDGSVYKHISSETMEREEIQYLQSHLRILSAMYGVLRPLDGIMPYRLDMEAKLSVDGKRDLYDFWDRKLYDSIRAESDTIINLASSEYLKCIEKFADEETKFVTVSFYEKSADKLTMKGTYAKMARGEMVNYMAKNKIESVGEIKKFNRMGYSFDEILSNENELIFTR